MKTKKSFGFQYIIILILSAITFSCGDDILIEEKQPSILLLQVNYNTSAFEGGFEYKYEESTQPFEYLIDFREPNDFGSVKVFHVGVEDLLFEGSIIWAGTGERIKPETLHEPNEFGVTEDELNPDLVTGFEEVFNPGNQEFIVDPAWNSLTNLQVVQDYLTENQQEIHYFLYQPSNGAGDPADWKWIFFLHK